MITIFNSSDITLMNAIIEFVLIFVGFMGLNVFVDYFVKRYFTRILVGSLSVVSLLSFVFRYNTLFFTLLAFIVILTLISLFVNMAEIRNLFANRFIYRNRVFVRKNTEVEKIFDKDNLYKIINDATLYFSKNKIGAIMTFQRNDDILAKIKNGVEVKAPVSFELLLTIFYPGTRLHDGAVVIKGDQILEASVFYTPTVKPLIGKYGSRHRAAIGISEVTDTVTVVVSEETGRISIAYNGDIFSYSPDNFYKAFENFMTQTDVISADEQTRGKGLDD